MNIRAFGRLVSAMIAMMAVLLNAGCAVDTGARGPYSYGTVGVYTPGVSVGVSTAPPVYYYGLPAYYGGYRPIYGEPAPVYVTPRPVHVERPLHVEPRPVYAPPRPGHAPWSAEYVAPGRGYEAFRPGYAPPHQMQGPAPARLPQLHQAAPYSVAQRPLGPPAQAGRAEQRARQGRRDHRRD